MIKFMMVIITMMLTMIPMMIIIIILIHAMTITKLLHRFLFRKMSIYIRFRQDV